MLDINTLTPEQQKELAETGEYTVRYNRYLQLDENRVITGILLSTSYEPDRTDIMCIPDDYPAQMEINMGWRLGDDSLWYPPPPPTEEELITKEMQELSMQYQILQNYENQCEKLKQDGIYPDSPEGRFLLPEPVYQPPEPARQDPNLLVAFTRLGNGGTLPAELEAVLAKVTPVQASVEPCKIPSKKEILSSLQKCGKRLEKLKGAGVNAVKK